MQVRVGFGFDTHAMVYGRDLWLGGVKIPHSKGCMGHSDADVLIHAICDSILGAAGMRDIGFHFKNTDPAWKNIDSKILLHKTVTMVRSEGYEIGNIDATLCLEEPKINPYVEQMCRVMCETMQIRTHQLSVKATTNEQMGYVGRKEGVNAYAVCIICKT